MDSTKPSTKKKSRVDNQLTMTAMDTKVMNSFDKYYKTLPDKQHLLAQLNRKKNGMRQKYTTEFHELCKQIKALEQEIEDMSNHTQKLDYLLASAPHFLEYSQTKDEVSKEIFNGFVINKGINKSKICDEYVKECIGSGTTLSTRSKEQEIHSELTCKNCGVEKVTNTRESYASCKLCGEVSRYQDTQNNKGEYSEEVEVISPFAYQRINHFKEWLNTLTGERSEVSDEVLDRLREEMRKEKIESSDEVTEELIKLWLKKLKLPKLYEKTPAIRFKLCGVPPPKISRELKDKLIVMFQMIQAPFEKYAPEDRANFLSYSYTLHKMCQLLRQEHLLDRLTLLKSREKLYYQDTIWKDICKEMDWVFISSI